MAGQSVNLATSAYASVSVKWPSTLMIDSCRYCQCGLGLAGVYDIAAHYKHESQRGVEDVSTMARAMYGPKRFDRFSPTVVIENLPPNAWSASVSGF